MVSTEDSEASWIILFWVFVVVVFPAAGSFVVFILRSLSSGGGLLFFFLFFFFPPPFPIFFCLSADFQVTKRSPAGGASTYTQKPA